MTNNTISEIIKVFEDTGACLAINATVADQFGAAALHINSKTENQFVITIANQMSEAIDITQLFGPISSSNYNIALHLPENLTYLNTLPTINTLLTPGTWELSTDNNNHWVSKIYLGNKGSCSLSPKGTAGDKLQLFITYSDIVPDESRANSIPVSVQFNSIMSTLGPLRGLTPPQSLAVISEAGLPLPLVGSFVGPSSILNDGNTQQNIKLRIVNTSAEPLNFIKSPSNDSTHSYIEVAFPVSDSPDSAIWALCDTSAAKNISPSISGSGASDWTIASTGPGLFTLLPVYSKIQSIPAGATLDIDFSGVTSALAPGLIQVLVSLHRFSGIGTQTFGVALEKSPLVYNGGLGTGMKLSAGALQNNNALQIDGSSNVDLVHINQSGSGPVLRLEGQGGLVADSVVINKAITVQENAQIYGGLSASQAFIKGKLTANEANITGGLTASYASIEDGLTTNRIGLSSQPASGSFSIQLLEDGSNTAQVTGRLLINGDFTDYIGGNYFNNAACGIQNNNFGQKLRASIAIDAKQSLILAFGFSATSDQRTKTLIGSSDSAKDLEILKKIEIVDFVYKDSTQPKLIVYKKVMGQQIEQALPSAVQTTTGAIPDILKPPENVAYNTAGDTLIVTLQNHGLKPGEKVKLIFDGEPIISTVLSSTDNTFSVANNGPTEKLFVYGRQVDDFRIVDYDAIAMLNVSATQALLRRIENLEAEKESILKRLSDLECTRQS